MKKKTVMEILDRFREVHRQPSAIVGEDTYIIFSKEQVLTLMRKAQAEIHKRYQHDYRPRSIVDTINELLIGENYNLDDLIEEVDKYGRRSHEIKKGNTRCVR